MKYNGTNLKKVLKAHERWINKSKGWSEDDRADLSGADLYRADLSRAELYRANLNGANLREANLYGADLYGANLREANLYGADLYGADLRGANLYGADLYGADLRGANLYKANLYKADLYEADLHEANLNEANLYEADLYGAKNIPFIPTICPDSGDFVAWKKCELRGNVITSHGIDAIVKLLIPSDAARSSATTRKCRASYAKVLEIQTLDGQLLADDQTIMDGIAVSKYYDHRCIYTPGEEVRPKEQFNTNRWDECASGIHFFINRQEAVNY